MLKRNQLTAVVVVVLLATIVAGCGGGAAPTSAPPAVVTSPPIVQTVIVAGTPQVQVVTATPGPTKPPAPTVAGAQKIIYVNANWGGGEREDFQAVMDAFTAKTNIAISYETDRDNLEAVLRTRVAGGNPPDVALDSRPGFISELAKAGNLIQLDAAGKEVVKPADLTAAFAQTYLDLGKTDGKLYGLIFKTDSKSTFWYRPPSFKALGTQAPKTMDDLLKVADQYKAAGKIPFAVGGKDAWTLTDYFENIYARVATPQQYQDLHVAHKVAWNDATVKKALTQLARFFQPGYEPGGPQGVVGTGFTDSIGQVFGPNPKAEMYYEGGFVGSIATSTFTNLKPGTDLDFWLFPQVDPAMGDPIIGGGDLAILFKDTPEGRSFIQFLASKEAADVYAARNAISPNKQLDPSKFTSALRKNEYQQLSNAKVFLFDGSDQAPNEFGGGCEFTILQYLVTHATEIDKVANDLEDCAKRAYK